MPNMFKTLNADFAEAFRALDTALTAEFGGVDGYLYDAEIRLGYKHSPYPDVERDLAALRESRVLYLRLLKTADPNAPIATEDHVDFLRDLLTRYADRRDPLTKLKAAKRTNNPDAEKYLPIESEAREISHRRVMRKKTKALVATALSLLTVGITVALRFRKGRTE